MHSPTHTRRRTFWQVLTVTLLVTGYTGYYVCRSNFSVTKPMIIAELGTQGFDQDLATIHLGTIASLGTLAYALGKFVSGGIGDFLGGRRNFLGGMIGAVLFTILFALGGGLPIFTLAWVGNRLVQSLGWVGMVKITSRWFAFSTYGTAMGFISLSYLFGDAIGRKLMEWLIASDYQWREVFYAAAGILLVLFLLNSVLLKDSPIQVGEPEPEPSPANLFGPQGNDPAPAGLANLLRPLLTSRTFWLVCLLSLGFTALRETFNDWTPTVLHQAFGLDNAAAAGQSAHFPFWGGCSVVLAGFLSDRLGRGGRAGIILVGLLATTMALAVLGLVDFGGSKGWPVGVVALIGFVMLGPYSYLAGALALDFGGKQGSATASGIIDGIGYLGGMLAGAPVARLAVAYGWQGAFAALAGMGGLTSIAAVLFFVNQRQRPVAPGQGA